MTTMDAIDTGTEDLLAAVGDGVATVTLNRPDRRNALSPAMLTGLGRVLADLDAAEDVGALVITGAGPAFCAGGDVKGFSERGGEGGGAAEVDMDAVETQVRNQQAIVGRLHAFTKPVLASLPGAAAGAGLGIALAADMRIGCPRTVLATAFARVGLSGDYGTMWLLRHLVGPAKAAEMMYLGDRVDADTSLRLGLLNWLVPEAELADRTAEVAARLANGPRLALRNMKSNLRTSDHAGLDEAMRAEVLLHKECGISEDHKEAVAAFVGKRQPTFANRNR
jgi:2-(1,2-epoxy-1,2-dihydrophenyl)acetyl-CoA isomerase